FDRLLSVRHTRPTPPSFFLLPLPPRATLFPYTTLFRSPRHAGTVPARCPGRATGGGAPTAAWPRPALAGPGTADRRLAGGRAARSEEHTSELQSRENLVCRLLLEKKKTERSQGQTHTVP